MNYGEFGGRYISEILMGAVMELEDVYKEALEDKQFLDELDYYLKVYVGRETPLYYAENLSKHCGGAKIYLKLIRKWRRNYVFISG